MSKQKNLPSWLLWSHHKGDPNVIHTHSHVETADSHILPQLAHLECLFPFFWQPVSSKLDLQNLYFFKSLHWESSHLTPRHGSAVFLSSLSSAHTWDSSPPGTLCFSIVLKIAFPPNLKVSSKRPRVHLPLHLCRWPWQNRDHSLLRDPPPLSPPHCLASYFFYETISWGRWPALHPPHLDSWLTSCHLILAVGLRRIMWYM